MKLAAAAVILLAAALTGCAKPIEASCSQRARSAPDTITINLYPEAREMRKEPGFYLIGSPQQHIVFYFKPEDVLAQVEKRAEKVNIKVALEAMRRDLPLDRDLDLFKYALLDQEFEFSLQYLLGELLDSGKAFVDLGPIYRPDQPHPGDQQDPRVILRVNWKTEGAAGRTWCTQQGMEINDIMDSIA